MWIKHLKFTLAVVLYTLILPQVYCLGKLNGRHQSVPFSEIKSAYLEIRDDIYFN